MTGKVTCYFSFRSPYSWLAFYRLDKIIDELNVEFELIPAFPPRGKITAAEMNEKKLIYIREDVKRFADAYGLDVRMPDPFDVNWLIPHAAFLYADDAGAGLQFCNTMYHARFSRGDNISAAEVIGKAADECGINAEAVIEAGRNRKYHHRVLTGLAGLENTNVFGVPTFYYRGRQYWGNDRLEWLVRAIYLDRNIPLPDLAGDPLLRPF